MPNKCPFCRREYSWSGPYEKHLRNAHANLDIILASTIQDACSLTKNVNKGIDILRHEGHLRQDSDYEPDPDPTGRENGALDYISHESHTEILNEPACRLLSEPTLYEGAGKFIGDVIGFEQEQSNLCQHLCSLFSSAHSFKLAILVH